MFPFSLACSVMLCFRIKHPHFYCIVSLSPLFPLRTSSLAMGDRLVAHGVSVKLQCFKPFEAAF